jgi:hypothetical protein
MNLSIPLELVKEIADLIYIADLTCCGQSNGIDAGELHGKVFAEIAKQGLADEYRKLAMKENGK